MAFIFDRIEQDFLGERAIPLYAYYGIHTLRAVENFPITGTPISIYPDLIDALVCIKQAASASNRALGLIDDDKAHAIIKACIDIRENKLYEHFVVDVIQGGAGASTNMNTNEVIANLGLETLGYRRGDYQHLHPNFHVNLNQTTQDVYLTALKVASYFSIVSLVAALGDVRMAFEMKAEEWKKALKIGDAQLCDVTPIIMGQKFDAYAEMLAKDQQRLRESVGLICNTLYTPMIAWGDRNVHPDYAVLACRHLADITAIPLRAPLKLVNAPEAVGSFVQLSSVLKDIAVRLSTICNDLRSLSSGIPAGFGPLILPSIQTDFGLLSDSVNPLIPDMVNQIAFEVIGNDVTIGSAADAGQWQTNRFEPIIVHTLFKSVTHIRNGCKVLAERCIEGIIVNRDRLRA